MKILLFKAHAGDLLSTDIKALMRTMYSHAAVLIDSAKWMAAFVALAGPANGRKYLLVEEFWPQARARWVEESEYTSVDVYALQGWDDAAEDLAMEFLLRTIQDGIAYDAEDLFRFLAPVRSLLGEASDDDAKRHMFCSYLVFQMCIAALRRLMNCHGFECSPDKLTWPMEVTGSGSLT